jgi:photosystem II stability/assembly factor-like uncharacterized protein
VVRLATRLGLWLCAVAGWLAVGASPSLAHQPHDPTVAIAFSPAYTSDQTVFVATSDVTVTLETRLVLRSTDGGLTWRVVPNFPNVEVSTLAISPAYATDGTLFAATRGGGLLRSSDRGATWTDVSGPLGPQVLAVALSPHYSTDQTAFAANAQGGLFKSTDGGASWAALYLAPTIPVVGTIAISPNYGTDQTILAGTTTQGVFRSTDGGISWSATNQGLANASITALAFSPAYASDRRVFAGTRGGVFVSTNGGTSWVGANSGIGTGPGDRHVTSLAVSPAYTADRTLFAATASGSVFRSTDAGASWTRAGATQRELSDQTAIHYRALGISPGFSTDRTLFLATFEGLWRSRDAGASWLFQEILPTYLVRSLTIAPDYPASGTVLAATYGGGVMRSTDGGQTWEPRNTGLYGGYPDPTDVSPAFASDRTIFVGTVYGPQRSTDGGNTWRLFPMLGVPVFARAVAVSPGFGSDQTVAIGTDNLGTGHPTWTLFQGTPVRTDGLFISTDGGQNWMPSGINGIAVHSIAFSPSFATDGTMFAASLYDGLFKSTDRGVTWAKVGGVPGTCCISRVAVSPDYAADRTVFASSPDGSPDRRGLYRSTDGGETWMRLPGTEALTVLDFALSPSFATDRTLFVGTLERGLLRSTNGGASFVPTNLRGAYVTALEVSPAYATDRTVFAATYGGVFRSQDAGASWTPLTTRMRVEEDRPSILRTGTWNWLTTSGASANLVLSSEEASATLQYTFVGTRIAWIGSKGPAQGIARVYLDGSLVATVDLYDPVSRLQQTLYQSPLLTPGEHTFAVVATGQRNAQASATTITLDALDIWR